MEAQREGMSQYDVPGPARAPRLALVELIDRDGAVLHRVPVQSWPVTIGRGLDCDVILDDPYSAALHLTLDSVDGKLHARVDNARNAVRIGSRELSAGQEATLDEASRELTLGRTRLRVRLAGEALEPERVLDKIPRWRGAFTACAFGLLLVAMLAEQWLERDPDDPLFGYLGLLAGVPTVLGLWCLFWALGSKLFTKHFDFAAHLRIALRYAVVMVAAAVLLPLGAFALGWPWLARIDAIVAFGLAWALIWAHISQILPARRQALGIAFVALFVVGTALQLGVNYQQRDRWFQTLYVPTLAPPALRVAPTQPVSQLIDGARALRPRLERAARETDRGNWLGDDEE